MSGPDLELEERLSRLAAAFKDGIEPPATLHVKVMASSMAPSPPVRRRSMLRELSLAAALVAFVGLLAFGFSRLHSVTPGPVKPSPSLSPVSRVIPWTSATPLPLKLQTPKTLTVDQAAQDVRQAVTNPNPVLLPRAVPSGFHAQLYDDAGSFSVTYAGGDGRFIQFSIVVSNLPPISPAGRQLQPAFRGVRADYQVDNTIVPSAQRWLMWNEPGTPYDGMPGVPYLLRTDGFTESEFWTIANSIGAVDASATPPTCRLADLDVVPTASTGPSGRALYRISLSNHGGTTCSLVGFADISLISFRGDVVTSPQSNDYGLAGTDLPWLVLLPPNQTAPGPHATSDVAYFVFEWYYCGATPPPISAIDIGLPGSAVKRRVGSSPTTPPVQARCDDVSQGRVLLVSAIQGAHARATAGTPPALRVTLAGVPDKLGAGQTLRYTVTIGNESGAPISFDTCPTYDEGFAPDGMVSYLLNCGPLGRLATGASATFAMEFTVRPGPKAPTGPQRFLWRLHGAYSGAVAEKAVTLIAP
jgi:hypothetical protein